MTAKRASQSRAARKTKAPTTPKPTAAPRTPKAKPVIDTRHPLLRFCVGKDPSDVFMHVMWGAKRGKHESERIHLKVNGIGREWARQVETIAPVHYLMAADNALHDTFQQVAGAPSKVLAPIAKCPYMVLPHKGKDGEATREQYEEMLRTGTVTYKKERLAINQQQAVA
jgi:hypothetical protein